jgi:hypothetical protein
MEVDSLYEGGAMKSVNELLKLFMRQAELESAMRKPGGARVIEEQELHTVRQRLAEFPEDVRRLNAPAPSAEMSPRLINR